MKLNNQTTSQTSLVAITKSPLNLEEISTSDLKKAIINIYEDAKPVTTQFTELIIIHEPINNLSITFIKAENKIIISNNNITTFSGRNNENLIKLSYDILHKQFPSNIKEYGFNIISDFTNQSKKLSGEYIKNSILKIDTILENPVISGSAELVYEKDKTRYSIKILPKYAEKMKQTSTTIATLNAHTSKKLPKYSDLSDQCISIYNNFPNILTDIIKK